MKKVKAALEERINMSGLSEMFGDIMIPTEQVTELKKGQKKQMERKFFPGYMLVQMEMNDDTWHLVRKTPNVMGFMGGTRNKPVPLSEDELNRITNRVEKTSEQPVFKTVFESGETVRINDGPFNDFSGTVEEVDYEKNLIRVSVSIFGKSTPVELNFSQVEKTDMAKEVMTIIKLQVPAGGANPSPPVGPALGQHGLNIMDFCNAFNDKTKEMEKGLKVPVEITVFEDRTFTFITKSPPAAVLLKKAAGIDTASGEPNRTKVAKIPVSKVQEIAEMKMEDLNANDIDAAIKIISGTARSMGIEIKE